MAVMFQVEVFVGGDAVQWCDKISTFQMSMLYDITTQKTST
jgi:hypothetical protein